MRNTEIHIMSDNELIELSKCFFNNVKLEVQDAPQSKIDEGVKATVELAVRGFLMEDNGFLFKPHYKSTKSLIELRLHLSSVLLDLYTHPPIPNTGIITDTENRLIKVIRELQGREAK